jgi:hypothetical protein
MWEISIQGGEETVFLFASFELHGQHNEFNYSYKTALLKPLRGGSSDLILIFE